MGQASGSGMERIDRKAAAAKAAVAKAEQKILSAAGGYEELDEWLIATGEKNVLVVCDDSLSFMPAFSKHLEGLSEKGFRLTYFRDFAPNPLYESAVKGTSLFRREGCKVLAAIGGGSAMDVAKCIKLYADLPGDGADGSWLSMREKPAPVPFLVMPTTAGTGSEATRYAVLYYQGAKQSITHEDLIPDAVLMDASVLTTLPLYQKKATLCDALCHAIESFWSVGSTPESRKYSRQAIEIILQNADVYLDAGLQKAGAENGKADNKSAVSDVNAAMLRAAHLAGCAINITQTTAGHAMCYKITSLFGCAHGHAAMLCDRVLFPWMIEHTDLCIDPRGEAFLKDTLEELGKTLGGQSAKEGADILKRFFERLDLQVPTATDKELSVLCTSVNPDRLRNHPIALDGDAIEALYRDILVIGESAL